MRRFWIVLSAGGVALFASLGHAAAAQTAPSSQPSSTQPSSPVLAITPAIQDRVIGATETSASFSVTVTNIATRPVTFSLSSRDFSAYGQTGGLLFQGSDINQVTDGHGLSGILQLDTRVVTIPAGGSKQVNAKVSDIGKLAPGGHYAAIIAQALPDGSGQDADKVAINQAVSSLLFLQTAGQGSRSLKLLTPPVNRLVLSLPASINLAFQSTGNTQVVPRGVVSIERNGHEIGRGIINDNSSLLLPGSTRLLLTDISGDKHPLWPGRFTMRIQYRYDGSLGVTAYQKTFWYVNIQAILIASLGVLLLMMGGWRNRRRLWRRLKRASQEFEPAAISSAAPTRKQITVSSVKDHNEEAIVVSKK